MTFQLATEASMDSNDYAEIHFPGNDLYYMNYH